MLQALHREKLLKISKSEFGKESLVYLDHIIGHGQLKIDPSKVSTIGDWQNPCNVAEVRSF